MIGLTIRQATAGFFDRRVVIAATDRAQRRVLSRFGAFVRQRARTSIRSRAGTSPPGQPPFSHAGLLRRHILFAYDHARRGVVVGPAALNQKSGQAPSLLEHGGVSLRRRSGRLERVVYAPRPFMRPALAAEQAKLPALWRSSVR